MILTVLAPYHLPDSTVIRSTLVRLLFDSRSTLVRQFASMGRSKYLSNFYQIRTNYGPITDKSRTKQGQIREEVGRSVVRWSSEMLCESASEISEISFNTKRIRRIKFAKSATPFSGWKKHRQPLQEVS